MSPARALKFWVVLALGAALGFVQMAVLGANLPPTTSTLTLMGFALGACLFWSIPLFCVEAGINRIRRSDRRWRMEVVAEVYIGACLIALFTMGWFCYTLSTSSPSGVFFPQLCQTLSLFWLPGALCYVVGAITMGRLAARLRVVDRIPTSN